MLDIICGSSESESRPWWVHHKTITIIKEENNHKPSTIKYNDTSVKTYKVHNEWLNSWIVFELFH